LWFTCSRKIHVNKSKFFEEKRKTRDLSFWDFRKSKWKMKSYWQNLGAKQTDTRVTWIAKLFSKGAVEQTLQYMENSSNILNVEVIEFLQKYAYYLLEKPDAKANQETLKSKYKGVEWQIIKSCSTICEDGILNWSNSMHICEEKLNLGRKIDQKQKFWDFQNEKEQKEKFGTIPVPSKKMGSSVTRITELKVSKMEIKRSIWPTFYWIAMKSPQFDTCSDWFVSSDKVQFEKILICSMTKAGFGKIWNLNWICRLPMNLKPRRWIFSPIPHASVGCKKVLVMYQKTAFLWGFI